MAATDPSASGGAVQVISVEEMPASRTLSAALARGRDGLTVIAGPTGALTREALGLTAGQGVDVVLAEPFFYQMQGLLLWQALNVWYKIGYLRRAGVLSPTARCVPAAATVKAVLVQFDDLWRNHGAVGTVSGFDHSQLDAVQAGWHQHALAYPTWMYPYTELSARADVWAFDFDDNPPAATAEAGGEGRRVELVVTRPGTLHGVVVWVDYSLTKTGPVLSTGRSDDGKPTWWKQVIVFLPEPATVDKGTTVRVTSVLDLESGKVSWTVDV